ncbi:MAG: efflux RND transporter periplasmic adaptor subunit [Gemmatimonadaceae bacterium]|nr:efflux RND transporter periplasmic adaptor subunit [Gemmatimonadaceae bacterium]
MTMLRPSSRAVALPRVALSSSIVGMSITLATLLLLGACGGSEEEHTKSAAAAAPTRVQGTTVRIADTAIAGTMEASGVAEPMQQAMLSTKLMGTVTAVLVKEGDLVRSGQAVVQIDARDVTAKAAQVAASIADAEAMQAEAATHAARFRALYADSAATRAQYDAALTGLARADAGVRAARAAASEVEAVQSYATVRAPFSGIVTQRMADPGTFAAPGAPLLTVQDVSTLRVSASVGAESVRALRRGQTIAATIDGQPVTARIEGIVPTQAGGLFTVNATVENRAATYRAGSTAVLLIPTGTVQSIAVPLTAIVRDGDLTGVIVRGPTSDERRWVRLGAATGTHVIVNSGLRVGDEIVIPAAPPTATKAGA